MQKVEADTLNCSAGGRNERHFYSSAYRVVDWDIISLSPLLVSQYYVKNCILLNRFCLKENLLHC